MATLNGELNFIIMSKERKTIIGIITITVMLLTANFLPARNSQKEQLDPPARVPYYPTCTFVFGNGVVEGTWKQCQNWRILDCTPDTKCHATIYGED